MYIYALHMDCALCTVSGHTQNTELCFIHPITGNYKHKNAHMKPVTNKQQ